MPDAQALVIDDDPDALQVLGTMLRHEGVEVCLAEGGEEGLNRLQQQPFKVLFTDLRMPGMDGLAVLQQAQNVRPQVPMVLITGHAELESCIAAMRLGACDYVLKPFSTPVVRAALGRALHSSQGDGKGVRRLLPERPGGCSAQKAPDPFSAADVVDCWPETDGPLVAQSAAMREVCDMIAKIAPSEASVLIEGESGAGKHLVALAIHHQSRRAGRGFVFVNCRAMPAEELGLRLFGEAGGGGMDRAHGGTLFLAHVEALPLWAQARLSDVLRVGRADRRGARCRERFDARLIASAGCDLEQATREGRFDADLYYLLSAIHVRVPPLRERQQDLKILADRCIEAVLTRQGAAVDRVRHHFSQDAWRCLLSHNWPGNLPELSAAVARAVALADGEEIRKEAVARIVHLAKKPDSEMTPIPLAGTLREIERRVVEEVIQRCRGNKAAAARSLGLHRKTLYRILNGDEADPEGNEPGPDSAN